jgi:phosphorylcholine metabolism protein LicD
VRHHGFIPWDDDMDIAMHRNDYERFLAVAGDELPESYHIGSFETSETNWNFLVTITSSSRMCFEPDYLDSHYGFPYMAGLDIFFLDNMPENDQDKADWLAYIRYIINVADLFGMGRLTDEDLEHALQQLEQISGTTLQRDGEVYERKLALYQLAVRECARYDRHPTPEITQLMPLGLYHGWVLSAADYASSIRMPFEHMDIPVPVAYDKLLPKKYPDYTTIRMGGSAHNYPYYITQKKSLGTDLDFVPKYSFSDEHLKKDRTAAGISLKSRIRQFLEKLAVWTQRTAQAAPGEYAAELASLQEHIITLGTCIEQTKGDGLPVISLMEQCCEALYELHETQTPEKAQALSGLLAQLKEALQKLLNRREAVFLPFKGEYWERFAPEWEAAAADDTCDVYVIPLPYYYKKYDGIIQEMYFHPEAYPENVPLTDYRSFDFSLHQPEEIYIQSPYDAYNMAITLPSFFYASNLKNYTDQLIYKPWFALADFAAENTVCGYNMQFYCTMPGVVQADQVWIDTPTLRQRYIECLTDFAGADTQALWEEKIKVKVPESN